MDSYSYSLIFMGAAIVAGLGVVIIARPDASALAGAVMSGLLVALADFVCAVFAGHGELWHLQGAFELLGVPISLSIVWIFGSMVFIILFDRIASSSARLILVAGAALGGAAIDHFLLRRLGILSWGSFGPLAIVPYWLVMLLLAVGVYRFIMRQTSPAAGSAGTPVTASEDWKPSAAVSLARCADYDPQGVLAAITSLLEPLGGMSAFVPYGATVLLKPNYLSYKPNDRAVCTHPSVIAAAARLCLDAGAGRVTVGDSPAIGRARGISRKLGLTELLGDLPVEVVDFTEPVEVKAEHPQAVFKTYQVARQIKEADVIVNLAKVKTHAQMTLTLAVKNCFGAVVGLRKSQWHLMAGKDYDYFGRMLVDLYRLVCPALNIVDGVLAMEGNGPSAGKARKLDFLAASADGLALDRVLTGILGFDPSSVPTLRVAGATGSQDAIELHGDSPDSFAVHDFKPARPAKADMATFIGRLGRGAISPRPLIDHSRCTRCGQCKKHCPPEVMSLVSRGARIPAGPDKSDEMISIDLNGCIRCFCCQEVCPDEAISVKEGWMSRLGLIR